ncbi:uncharacterized protein M6B38_252095 [Iris pallida]|uniref:Uncharacterized protein n=1 Tax=Iris pallida TaxID=29817 RepID=A0AAX6IID0_IRIPA|nr:uncharacterized protein M6B38_252095 [Iris pallida]
MLVITFCSSCIGAGDAMERPKKDRVKGSRWSGSNNKEDCRADGKCNGSSSGGASDGEEGYIFRVPLNSNGHSSRKRIKLQAEVSDDYKPVDPAMVPRRLRSAINKRPHQSVSPPLSDSKRKQLHALNGIQLSNCYIAERSRQNKLDQVTKDEEEVAVALTMLASPITESKLIKNKEEMITLEENSEMKEASTCFSEAPNEEPTKALVPCNGSIGTNSSPCVEESHKDALKAQPSALGRRIAASVSQNFDAGMSRTKPDLCVTPLSMNRKEGDVTSLRDDAKNSSYSPGTSLQYLAGNGRLQETQVGASSMWRRDVGLWPLGSAPAEHELQSVKQKLESGTTHYISQKEINPVMWPGLSSSAHGHLTIPSSKTTGCPKSLSASARCSSTTNDPPAEMLSSINRKAPCKKCATHVYISHVIRNYQNTEKRQQASQPVNQSKAKEGTSSASQAARGLTGLRNSKVLQSNGFHVEKGSMQGSTRMLHDGRVLQAQLISPVSGAYGHQKQAGEFLSMLDARETKNSGNGSKSCGQLHVPYLPSHSLMPFPFAQGPYPPHYQDQLALAASHQVQLQLSHFVGTSPKYGPQMVHTAGGTTTKQQQQMLWQAQMAHYRPTLGFPAQWQQNGQHPDSFPSSQSLCSQPPPSKFPIPKDYQPAKAQQHFLLPVPSPLSRVNQQQQHQQNCVALNLDGSTQLQMLCNTGTFR